VFNLIVTSGVFRMVRTVRPHRSASPSDGEMDGSSTKFKLLRQIKGNPINDYDFFKVRNFRYWQLLCFFATGSKKPNYVTEGKTNCDYTGFLVARER
jgi:hypothetical protein